MRKIKTQRDKELYGELNLTEAGEQYWQMIRNNFIKEYSKAFTVYNKIHLEDLGETFHNYDGDLLRLVGQFEQKLMIVQHVETGRHFKLPTSEVAWGFEQKRKAEVQDI
jgi:hypothetical protein